ncbi:MAG TPA: pyrimidine reductase family protein, partial [Streptomyces sp.]|nr:pyrimidine reductase family protein [Streptomyces sp.]
MRRLFPVTDQTVPTGAPGTVSAGAPGAAPDADHEWSLDQLADAYAYPA